MRWRGTGAGAGWARDWIAAVFVLALVALLAGSAPVAAAGKKSRKRANPWSLLLRAEGQVRYDDNILMLSETEQDRVDPSDPNNADRFGVSRPEDGVFSPSLRLTFSRAPKGGLETEIGFSARSWQYFENTIKNYQQYGLSVRQELNRSRAHRTTLRVGASTIPEYYLRQLVDDDESAAAGTTIHNAADYQLNRGYVELSQEVVDGLLTVTAGYARERRDYNLHFDERDASSDIVSAEAWIYPLRRTAFRIRPYAEWENRRGRGDAPGTIVVDDVGYESDRYGLELRGRWGRDADHRRSLRGYYETEARGFAATDPADTAHFDREDDVVQYGAGYTHELGPRWEWGVWAYRREVDVSISRSSFEKSVVGISLTWRQEHRFGRGGDAPAREP